MSEPAKINLGDTGADPADNPSVGYLFLYAKNGMMFVKDSSGVISGVAGAPTVTGTTASPTLLINSDIIAVLAVYKELHRIAGSGGAVTGVTLANGTLDGQEVTLEGCHATNTVTMTFATGDIVFAVGTLVTVTWNSVASAWRVKNVNYN